MNYSPIKFLCLFLLSLAITGCQTFNAQVLDLHPEVTVTRQLPKDIRVDIKTQDLRSSEVIGHRLHGKEPYPAIVLKDNLGLLQHAAEHALEDMGVRRFYQGGFTLQVSLLELNYVASKQTLKQNVAVDMKLRLKVSKGDKSYTGTYATNKQQSFLKTPSEEDNQKLIGTVVEETMGRAFNDPQLLDFFQFN